MLLEITFARPFGPYSVALKRVLLSSMFLSLAGALILHLTLAFILLKEKAYAPSASAQKASRMDPHWGGEWTRRSLTRFFRMLFVPSYLRWQTLNLRAFEGALLRGMPRDPRLFLTAVDLNEGRKSSLRLAYSQTSAVTVVRISGTKEPIRLQTRQEKSKPRKQYARAVPFLLCSDPSR